MKKVILTNSTVIPFYKKNASDADEIVKVIPPREGSDFKSIIVSFNVETKATDSAESKARLFEQCTIYAKNDDQVNTIRQSIKSGAIVELEGYERRTKAKEGNKYYTNIIVKTITPISAGVEEAQNNYGGSSVPVTDDDLPF